jgi:hypothetical protein
VIATLYLGILPNRVLEHAHQSAQDLLPQPAAASTFAKGQTPPAAGVPRD